MGQVAEAHVVVVLVEVVDVSFLIKNIMITSCLTLSEVSFGL